MGTNILVLDDDNAPPLLGIIQGKADNELRSELSPFSIKSRNYTLCVEKSTEIPIKENFFCRNSELGLKIRFWAKSLFGGLFPEFCMAI